MAAIAVDIFKNVIERQFIFFIANPLFSGGHMIVCVYLRGNILPLL